MKNIRYFYICILIALMPVTLLACKPPVDKAALAKLSKVERTGKELYDRKCLSCHAVNGYGGRSASDLSHIGKKRSAKRLDSFLVDPKSVDPTTTMNAVFARPDERAAMVEYMMTLK